MHLILVNFIMQIKNSNYNSIIYFGTQALLIDLLNKSNNLHKFILHYIENS
jgi:hypothetical protein